MANKNKGKWVVGFYHEHGYEICTREDGQIKKHIYTAGNNPAESTSMVPLSEGVSLRELRHWCHTTGTEMARELSLPWGGAERIADPYLDDEFADEVV